MDTTRLNLVTTGCPGCHIVDVATPWLLGVQAAALPKDAPPKLQQASKQYNNFDVHFSEDLAPLSLFELNTTESVLAIENFSVVPRVAFVSASSQHTDQLQLFDVNQQLISHGFTSSASLPKKKKKKKKKKPAAAAASTMTNSATTTTSTSSTVTSTSDSSASTVSSSAEITQASEEKFSSSSSSAEATKAPDTLVPCITFIVIVPPRTCLLLARLKPLPASPDPPELFKLSFPLVAHADPEGKSQPFVPRLLFPLPTSVNGGSRSYLCTQGMGGRLTHFFPESFHAVDFRCPEGTPLLAVADGVILEIEQKNSVTGIHCSNLGSWNSLSLVVDDASCNPSPSTSSSSSDSTPLSKSAKRYQKKKQMAAALAQLALDPAAPNTNSASSSALSSSTASAPKGTYVVDYVHIQPGSARVKVGDRVKAGDAICLSGAVGFAPEPHVHIEMHLTNQRKGPSAKFTFAAADSTDYVPMAGAHYPSNGALN